MYQQPLGSESSSLEVLSRYLDSTHIGLLSEFHSIESDKHLAISAVDVARELCQQGLYTNQGSTEADTAFHELIDMISTDCGGSVDGSSSSARKVYSPEFMIALRNLRLAAILHDESLTGQDMLMNLHEYGEKRLNSACPIENPIAFLFKPAPELFLNPYIQAHVSKITGRTNHPVKWLHVRKASKRVIMGLAVKYALDSRFVFHVLSLGSTKAEQVSFCDVQYEETAKAAADASSPNSTVSKSASSSFEYTPISPNLMATPSIDRPVGLFLVLPIMRLSEHSRGTLRQYQAWRRSLRIDANRTVDEKLNAAPCLEIIIEHCNLAMFVSGVAEGGTAISFSSELVELMKLSTAPKVVERRSAKISWLCNKRTNNTLVDLSSGFCPINQTVIGSKHSGTGNTPSDCVSKAPQLAMPNKVLAELKTSYTQLRCGDAHILSFIALREITEDYRLIADAYKAFLEIVHERIAKEKDNLCSKEVSRITESIKQLSRLNEVVGPVAKIAETISSGNQWSGRDIDFLSNIRSNASAFLKSVSTSKKMAEFLMEEYSLYRKIKTRSPLNPITLVSAMFMLGQVLKWLCGLNFHLYVLPLMPTVTLEHVYVCLWSLVVWTLALRSFCAADNKIQTN